MPFSRLLVILTLYAHSAHSFRLSLCTLVPHTLFASHFIIPLTRPCFSTSFRLVILTTLFTLLFVVSLATFQIRVAEFVADFFAKFQPVAELSLA
jgi:hypothetical protein